MKSLALVAVVAVGLLSCTPPGDSSKRSGSPDASSAATSSGSELAATVSGKKITVAEIDEQIESELARLETQRYQARRRALDQMIDRALIDEKAKKLGVDESALYQQEVGDKIKPPSDEDVKKYYEENKERISQPFEEIEPRIKQALLGQAMQAEQQRFLASLRDEFEVDVALSPPRVEIDTAAGRSVGPEDAPITLIEFSDYQCPFCARSQETVEKVLDEYGDKVRHVFMDFPIERIHPQAKPASIAARCAGEQGKFDEYHAILFENQRQLSEENFDKWAKELELDMEKFSSCLESDVHDSRIQATLAAGQSVGVTGTPAFFVNGVMINGAQPYEVFEELIEEELARS